MAMKSLSLPLLLLLGLLGLASAHCPDTCVHQVIIPTTKRVVAVNVLSCKVACLKVAFKWYQFIPSPPTCSCTDTCQDQNAVDTVAGTAGLVYTCFPQPRAKCTGLVAGPCVAGKRQCPKNAACATVGNRHKCCCNPPFPYVLAIGASFYGCSSA